MIAAAPTLPQPTIRLPLPPTASPAGEHDVIPMVPKSIVRRTFPEVSISATPPGLGGAPGAVANAGMETKNVPVFESQAGCSMPPAAIPPWEVGTVIWLL